MFPRHSWLKDSVKRKLVDFAWNRRFFYLPGACSFFLGEPGYKFRSTLFFYPERLFWSIVGSTSGEPGETGRGGAKKIKKSASFLFEASCSQRRRGRAHAYRWCWWGGKGEYRWEGSATASWAAWQPRGKGVTVKVRVSPNPNPFAGARRRLRLRVRARSEAAAA